MYRNDVVVSDEIPEAVKEIALAKRTELIEQLAEVDEAISEIVLMDETPSNVEIADAIRRTTIGLKFSPVFLGSAIKNTGVQPLLDGVCAYLPTPAEKEVFAHDTNLPANSPQVPLTPAANAPLVGLAFKLEEGRFGQLTYMRVYQGSLKKSMQIYNARTGKKVKVPRLVRMHSNEMEVSEVPWVGVHPSIILYRILILLVLAKFVPSLVLNALQGIPSPMVQQVIRW